MSYRFARKSWSCSQAVSKPVWHIPLLCVQWKTPDDGQRNCPKHVEFYSKNKFEKLVHLVGFIIRIYYDTRSRGRQIHKGGSWTVTLSLHERVLTAGKKAGERETILSKTPTEKRIEIFFSFSKPLCQIWSTFIVWRLVVVVVIDIIIIIIIIILCSMNPTLNFMTVAVLQF